MSDLSLKFKKAVRKTLNRIETTKQRMGCKEDPYISDMFDGVLVHCLSGWSSYRNIAKEKGFNVDNSALHDVNIYFIPKDGVIECTDNEHSKTIICLEGELDIKYNDVVKQLKSLSVLDINKNVFHCVTAHLDSFAMLIEH